MRGFQRTVSPRNRAWLCFRPVSIETEVEETEHPVAPRNHFSDYMDDSGQRRVTKTPSSLSDSVYSPEESNRCRRFKRSLSRVVRAVVFESSLQRSIHGRELTKSKSFGCLGMQEKSSSKTKLSKRGLEEKPNSRSTLLLHSKSVSSSSTSSDQSSDSGPYPKKSPQPGSEDRDCSLPYARQSESEDPPMVMMSARFVLFLFLICLMVTVFWGRLSTLMLTATCLFILPSRKVVNGHRRPVKLPGKVAGDCEKPDRL